MNADIQRALIGLPGTGKTTSLMELLQDELTRGVDPGDICASTYRKRMATEFETRAREVVDEWPEEDWMGTTHSLCFQMLGAEEVVDESDKADFCDEIGVGYSRGDDANLGFGTLADKPVGDIAFTARSYCLNTNRDPKTDWRGLDILGTQERADVESRSIGFEAFNERYEGWKRSNGLIDYDDMLLEVRKRGLVPPCEVLIEDEFQDKSPLQIDVFEQWADEIDRVYVAGDPFQAIYGFAGTDPEYMNEAAEIADETQVLDTSYRFGPELWRFATSIIEKPRGLPDVPEIDPVGESSVEKISYSEYQQTVADHTEDECLHLFRCNYMADKASNVLDRLGVPFSSPRGVRWSQELLDLYNGTVKLMNTVQAASAANDKAPLRVEYSLEHITAREALQIVRAIRAGHVSGTKKTAAETLRAAADPENGEVERDDVELRDILKPDWVEGIQNPFQSDVFIKSGLGGGSQRERLSAAYKKLDGDVVDSIHHRILTMHGSKGSEAEHVFLFNGISRKIKDERGLWPSADPAEARVFFVAATRAKHNLYLVEYPDPPKFRLPRRWRQ